MALEAGALDVLPKAGAQPESLGRWRKKLAEVVEGARTISMESLLRRSAARASEPPISGAIPRPARHLPPVSSPAGLVVAASTGGPPALRELFLSLSPQNAVVGVAQHMPAPFTRSLAQRLSSGTPWDVREAASGTEAITGRRLDRSRGRAPRVRTPGRPHPAERGAERSLDALVPIGRRAVRVGRGGLRRPTRGGRPDRHGRRRGRGEPGDRRRGRNRPLRVARVGRHFRNAGRGRACRSRGPTVRAPAPPG